MPAQATSKDTAKQSVLCYLYPGPLGGHNTFALKDETGNLSHLSYNSITQDYIQKQKTDPNYVPPNTTEFAEDDLPYKMKEFWDYQAGPMYNSEATIITDPNILSETLPTPVEIPLTKKEFKKAQIFQDNTKEAVRSGQQRYSIWSRRSGDKQLDSCASVSQKLLSTISRPSEAETVEASWLEQHTSALPTQVHKRAKALSQARTKALYTKDNSHTFFKHTPSTPTSFSNEIQTSILNPFA